MNTNYYTDKHMAHTYWIDVCIELPQECMDVLITRTYDYMGYKFSLTNIGRYDKGQWYDTNGQLIDTKDVIAWALLPLPYDYHCHMVLQGIIQNE